MTKSLTDLVQGVKKSARGIAAAGLIGATMFFSNGCGTPIEKPVITLQVSDSAVESGENIDFSVYSNLNVSDMKEYSLSAAPLDSTGNLPINQATPINTSASWTNPSTTENLEVLVWADGKNKSGISADDVSAIITINPQLVNPKPVATLWVSDTEIESGEFIQAKVTSNIPEQTSTYILKGSVDLGATIPLTISLPIDVNLAYENKTGSPVVKNLEAQVISNKDVASDKVYKNFTVNSEIVTPKPNALFEVAPLEIESGESVRVTLESDIPTQTVEYTITGSVDKNGIIPFSQGTPIDRYLVYENKTESPVTKTLTAKVKNNEGVFSNEITIPFVVNPEIIEDYINLSGVVEDSETDTPLPGAQIRLYRPDGTLIDSKVANSSGAWTADFLKYEGDDKIIIQAGIINGDVVDYYVRTTSVPNEDKSNILVRVVPNDLDGFKQFIYETNGSGPRRFDSTGFQGFKILTQNPTGNGTFTQQQAEDLQSLALDPSNNIEMILNTSDYLGIINPSEPYTPDSRNAYLIPDTDIPIRTSYPEFYGDSPRVIRAVVVRINPTGITKTDLEWFLEHELGHIRYPNHTSNENSIMCFPYKYFSGYQPLDLKGTYIGNEPTYIGTADGWDPNTTDYTENILKESWGLPGTIGYNSKIISFKKK